MLKPDELPRTMLYRALEHQAHELLEARRKTVAALKTPEAVRQRQTEIRAKFLEALGDFPEKTPLNARVVGTDQRDGYRVEKVIYESRPDHHVTAILYLPEADPPVPRRPGAVRPQPQRQGGRDLSARLHPPGQERHGRPLLRPDRPGRAAPAARRRGQGRDRRAARPSTRWSASASLLVGRSAATYRIWDGIRSLDYLASRPEIDPKRLGCTGNSGGGTLTAYLMALDDRIAVAAPSCYITSLERLFATIGPQDAEQNITGQVAFGMEHADYVILRAPKPTLISRRHARLLRHPGDLGHLPRGEAGLRPARPRRAGRPVRVGRAARLHEAAPRGRDPLDATLAAARSMTPRSRPTSPIATDAAAPMHRDAGRS